MNAILATTDDFLLALKGTMPWTLLDDLKEISKMDMKFFREKTRGATIVMGYNTWLSLNETPLAGRGIHYIITSKKIESTNDVKYVTLEEFKNKYMKKEQNLWCIGGAMIYEKLIPYCENIYWNEIVINRRSFKRLVEHAPGQETLYLSKILKDILQTRGKASYVEISTQLMSDKNDSMIVYHHIMKKNTHKY